MANMILRIVHSIAPSSRILVTRAGSRPDNQHRACVVILGWGGSKARNLTKVRAFYEKDCKEKVGTVISFSMPLLAPEIIRKLLIKRLVDDIPAASDVIVHAFSNNGMWVFGEICEEIHARKDDKARPTKLIVDSAPGFFYENMSLSSVTDKYHSVILSVLLNKNQYHHPILSPILKPLIYLCGGILKLLYLLPGGAWIVPDLRSRSIYLRDKCPAVPSLYIYGGKDGLIPEQLITDFVDTLNHRYGEQTPIKIVKFEGARHVSSFWDRETEHIYRTEVRNFAEV